MLVKLALPLFLAGCCATGAVVTPPHGSASYTPPSLSPPPVDDTPPVVDRTPPSPPSYDRGRNNRGHGNANENSDPSLNGGENRDPDNPGRRR